MGLEGEGAETGGDGGGEGGFVGGVFYDGAGVCVSFGMGERSGEKREVKGKEEG